MQRSGNGLKIIGKEILLCFFNKFLGLDKDCDRPGICKLGVLKY